MFATVATKMESPDQLPFLLQGIQTRERPASFVKRLVSLVVKSTGIEAIGASIATRV